MKPPWLLLLLLCPALAFAQSRGNLFIITTDGLRWQEVFGGADSTLLHDSTKVSDVELSRLSYWAATPGERRKKLLPFFWSVIESQGQLWGNRNLGSRVNVKNIFKVSYPGYNELLTGIADPWQGKNRKVFNRNKHLLEDLDRQPGFSGKIAAFSSWELFPYILNTPRNGLPLDHGTWAHDTAAHSIRQTGCRYDELTFLHARRYISDHHPRVVFLSFGETDEYAHRGRYDLHLQSVARFDRMLGELWYQLQTDPFYRNQTTLLITTDHGRGAKARKWQTHDMLTRGSGQIWMALLGKDVAALGEMERTGRIHLNQLAATAAGFLRTRFDNGPLAGKAVPLPQPRPPAMASRVPW